MTNVFEFTDYKAYLRTMIKQSKIRGFSSRLAEAAGCQKSYLSSSLGGKAHLLPDHIYGISEYLKLTHNEQEFLILTLDYQRANSISYRKFVLGKIHEKQNQWKDLKNRVSQKNLLGTENANHLEIYYSNHLYGALHIAVSIPSLQNVKALSSFFAIGESVVSSYLEELKKMDLVQSQGNKWFWKKGDFHLPKNSPWIQNHHNNWRLQALMDIGSRKSDSLHYSVVQSLSQKDLEKLRFQMVRWIQDFRDVTAPSDPEELICFNLDFFTLNKNPRA